MTDNIELNASHIRWGSLAMAAGTPSYFAEDPKTNAVDVITNVLHAWRTMEDLSSSEACEGAQEILDMATMNFRAETLGEDELTLGEDS